MELTRREFLKDTIFAGIALNLPLLNLARPKKAHASSEYQYSFPHFVGNNNWLTGITLTNNNSQEANVNLKAHDSNSSVIAEKTYTLKPHESLSKKVEYIFGVEGAGDIIINSDKPLTGQETFTPLNGNYFGNMSSLLLNTANDTKIYFPHIASNSEWKTGLAFCNPNSLDTLVRLTMFNTSGEEIGYNELEVPKYSPAPTRFAKNLFNNGFPLDETGYVQAESDLPINGLEIFVNSTKGMAGLNAVLHKELSKTIYFPHFASSDLWWTGLGVCNPNNQEARVNFNAYNPEGEIISQAQKIISANAQMTPKLIKNLFPNLTEKTGWIQATATQPIAGIEIFGNAEDIVGLNACANPSNNLCFPKVINNQNLYSSANPSTITGLAFVNPNNEPVEITSKAYNDNGSLTDSENITLKPHEQRSEMSFNFAPNLGQGHIELSSNKNIIGLQIHMDKNSNLSGTLAQKITKEPVTGSLENILYGGIIAGAGIKFYDGQSYISSTNTDSKGEFKIPDLATRVRMEKQGYHTRETNIASDNNYDLINSSFDMDNFGTIFRGEALGGSWPILGVQRWLKENEAGQKPKWYIDLNTDWCDVSKIPQSWIDLAEGTIRDKLTQLPIEIVKNPHIEIGYNPPMHYGGNSGTAPRPDEGHIWVKWARGPPYLPRDLTLGIHNEFGLNDATLNYYPGMPIAAGMTFIKENMQQAVYTQEFGQVLGARNDTYDRSINTAFFAHISGATKDYTTFDKNGFKISYNRPLGNTNFEGIMDYDPVE